jgi:hypothetical protein
MAQSYLDDVQDANDGEFPFPVFSLWEEVLKDATPIGSGVPWKCVLSPEMVMLGCYNGHGDDEGLELLLEAQGVQ